MSASPSLGRADAPPSRQRQIVTLWLPLAIVIGLALITALVLRGPAQIAVGKGIVQGLGEPLPISSSAHLIVTPWFFNWNDPFFQSQTFDLALHMGTLIALLGFFWRDLLGLLRYAHRPSSPQGRMFWLIGIGSLPGALAGLLLDKYAENFFQERYLVIALALAVMGVILYLVDRIVPPQLEVEQITWRIALLIGISQAAALVPGVSRSGATMTMGRAMRLTRESAARFSFLMAVPITAGAGLYKLRHLDVSQLTAPFWLGIGVSTLVGALAIGFLLQYVRTKSFLPFVIYRIVLAALIVAVYFARG